MNFVYNVYLMVLLLLLIEIYNPLWTGGYVPQYRNIKGYWATFYFLLIQKTGFGFRFSIQMKMQQAPKAITCIIHA